MIQFFDPQENRLIYAGYASDSNYWDSFWQSQTPSDLRRFIKSHATVRWVPETTRRYLQTTAGPILEGGCGRGQWVHCLNVHGFNTVGLDFAPQTIARIKESMPELNVVQGDVMQVPFPDSHFAGYWSFGVIEHFWDGYEKILSEAHRVLKPGGYLFLTFPVMSPLRRWKASCGAYPTFSKSNEPIADFYQFALPAKQVIQKASDIGFTLAESRPMDGVKGLKDEIALLSPLMRRIYGGKSLPLRLTRGALNVVLSPFSAHINLLVLRRN